MSLSNTMLLLGKLLNILKNSWNKLNKHRVYGLEESVLDVPNSAEFIYKVNATVKVWPVLGPVGNIFIRSTQKCKRQGIERAALMQNKHELFIFLTSRFTKIWQVTKRIWYQYKSRKVSHWKWEENYSWADGVPTSEVNLLKIKVCHVR